MEWFYPGTVAPGPWPLALGSLAPGPRLPGPWPLVRGARHPALGSLVRGPWCAAPGAWCAAPGAWAACKTIGLHVKKRNACKTNSICRR